MKWGVKNQLQCVIGKKAKNTQLAKSKPQGKEQTYHFTKFSSLNINTYNISNAQTTGSMFNVFCQPADK